MKRNDLPFCLILTLALLAPFPLCTTPAGAQNIRCTYTHQKKDDPDKGYKTYPDMLLDICEGRSLFYNEREFVYDSLFSLSFDENGTMLKNEAAEKLSRASKAFFWMTALDYPDGTFTQYYSFFQTIIGNGVLEMPAWKLTDEEKEITGYVCRKATAHYLGRDWTAWFTEDVPSQAGPWLLWGLPGLIVEARDADHYILFKLTGVESLNDNHRAVFLTNWLRSHTNRSHNVYEYDFPEAESVYTKMRSDISFAAHMSNPGARIMAKDQSGKMVPLEAPPYIPMIPTEYWKTRFPIVLKRFICLLPALLAGCWFAAFAQTTVTGVVRDKQTKEPVAGAFVLGLSGQQQKSYGYSNGEGRFILKVPEGVTIDQLRVSMMGFATEMLSLAAGKKDGIVVELTEKRAELRAAQVTARVVEERGDTLSYTAGAFKDGTERSMGELLEKLPGITVTASGGIQHNGKFIGKLYVEGLDLMGAQYGTVTKNLSADAIARVEVYQNHQPIQALQDLLPTDRSAINIILKERARSTWMFSGDAAIGLPPFPLFEARAMLTHFGRKRQSLFLIKGNNDGGDILQELQRQSILGRGPGAYLITPGEVDADMRSRLNPGRSYLPLPKEYWYDNLSGLGTFNHLVKLGETRQLRLVTQVAGERYNEASESLDEIRFADGFSLAIREARQMDDRRGYFSGTLAYEDNAPQHYVSDELTVAGQLRANNARMLGNSHPYTEHFDLPTLKLENSLKVVRRPSERRALEINSDSQYRSGQHEAVYTTEGREYGQHLLFQDFSADVRTAQNWSRGRHRISLTGTAALAYTGREAQARNLPLPEPLAGVKTEGPLSAWALRPSARISDRMTIGKADLTLSLPATLHYLILQGRDNVLYPTVNPSFALRWKLSQQTELSASTSYALTRSDPESLLDAAVMTSWRSLSTADSLRRSARWNTQATLRWSDMPTMFFATLSGSYSAGGGNRAFASIWTETLSYQYYLPMATTTSGWSVSGSLKKYFGLKAFVVEFRGSWRDNRMQEYLQGVPLDYRSSQLQTQLDFTINPVWWFSTDVSGRFDINYVNGDTQRRTRMAQVEGSLRLKPVKALSLDATTHWLWYEIPGVTVSNTPLIKISASWALKNATLFVECRNLLNATEYRRESISTYRTTTSVTVLRGRMFLAGIRMSR